MVQNQRATRLKPGEALFEVETEKVLYEVEAPADGTVARLLYALEAVVGVGLPVAIIAEAGEEVAEGRRTLCRRGSRSGICFARARSRGDFCSTLEAGRETWPGARHAGGPEAGERTWD